MCERSERRELRRHAARERVGEKNEVRGSSTTASDSLPTGLPTARDPLQPPKIVAPTRSSSSMVQADEGSTLLCRSCACEGEGGKCQQEEVASECRNKAAGGRSRRAWSTLPSVPRSHCIARPRQRPSVRRGHARAHVERDEQQIPDRAEWESALP